MNGYIRRELTPQLAAIERQAKQGVIEERVWLAAFQYETYVEGRDMLLEHLLPCTKNELKKLGVI